MSFKKDELPDLHAEPHQQSLFQNAILVRKSQCTVDFKASSYNLPFLHYDESMA